MSICAVHHPPPPPHSLLQVKGSHLHCPTPPITHPFHLPLYTLLVVSNCCLASALSIHAFHHLDLKNKNKNKVDLKFNLITL